MRIHPLSPSAGFGIAQQLLKAAFAALFLLVLFGVPSARAFVLVDFDTVTISPDDSVFQMKVWVTSTEDTIAGLQLWLTSAFPEVEFDTANALDLSGSLIENWSLAVVDLSGDGRIIKVLGGELNIPDMILPSPDRRLLLTLNMKLVDQEADTLCEFIGDIILDQFQTQFSNRWGTLLPATINSGAYVVSCHSCGDCDGSGLTTISDAVYIIQYVFAGGPPPVAQWTGDVDCSGIVNISDAVYLITYIFAGGSAPCAQCP